MARRAAAPAPRVVREACVIDREKSTALDAVGADDLGRLSRLLHRDIRRRGIDPGTADDLVQEAWLRTFRSARPPEGARLARWLRVVGRRLVAELHRANGHRSSREHAAARSERSLAPEPDAGEARVVRLVRELSEPYRTVLELHFLEERSVHEIARALGRTPGTVRSQLVRGLERLRARLGPEDERRSRSHFEWLARALATLAGARAAWRWSAALLVAVLGVAWFALRTGEERGAPVLAGTTRVQPPEFARESTARAPVAAEEPATPPAAASESTPPAAPSRRVAGTVRAPDGTPVPGAEVWYGARTGDGTAVAVSDALGRYAVESVDPKRFLWATHPAWTPAHRVYSATIAPEGEHDLFLTAARGRVELHVLTHERLPASGVRIAFDCEPGSEHSYSTPTGALEVAARFAHCGTSDERGVLALAEPDLALTEFEARRDGRLLVRGELELSAGDQRVELLLPRAPELRGLVLDPDGRPAAGATVEVHQYNEGIACALTDADGRFALAELAPGEFTLTACSAAGTAGATERGTLADGERQALRLATTPRGLIRGHALDGTRPIAGARVTLYRSGLPGQPEEGSTLTDAAGAFAFVSRDDLELRLELQCPGDDYPCGMAESLHVGEGSEGSEGSEGGGEVALRVQPELRVLEPLLLEFVRDEAGRLPSLVDLRCWRPRVGCELPVDALTGRVTFRLPRGKYELNAWVPGVGFWHARKHLETGPDVQRVALPRPGEVELVLDLEPGVASFEAELQMGGFNPFGFDVRGAFSHSRAFDATNPRNLRATLFPGKYDYSFRALGCADEFGRLKVGEGELTRIELAPMRGTRVDLRIEFPPGVKNDGGVDVRALGPFGEHVLPVKDARVADTVVEYGVRLPLGTTEVAARTTNGLVGSVGVPEGFLAAGGEAGRLRIELRAER